MLSTLNLVPFGTDYPLLPPISLLSVWLLLSGDNLRKHVNSTIDKHPQSYIKDYCFSLIIFIVLHCCHIINLLPSLLNNEQNEQFVPFIQGNYPAKYIVAGLTTAETGLSTHRIILVRTKLTPIMSINCSLTRVYTNLMFVLFPPVSVHTECSRKHHDQDARIYSWQKTGHVSCHSQLPVSGNIPGSALLQQYGRFVHL